MVDAVYSLAGLEAMKNFKADELECLGAALGIALDSRQVGFLDGFFVRPMNPAMTATELEHMAYLEGFSEGAAARREINSKYKGGRK